MKRSIKSVLIAMCCFFYVSSFAGFDHDISPVKIINPDSISCPDSNATLKISIKNLGKDTARNFKIFFIINGKSDSAIISGPFLPFALDTFNFPSKKINTFSAGTFRFKIFTALKNDEDNTNDTLVDSIKIAPRPKAKFLLTYFDEGSKFCRFSPVDSTAKGLKYQWDFGDGTKIDTTMQPPHMYSHRGFFVIKLIVTNQYGCKDESMDSVNFSVIGNVGKQSEDVLFSLYPNPANYILNLQTRNSTKSPAILIVTDLLGKQCIRQTIVSDLTGINISTLPSGMYLLRYECGETIIERKFVK